MVRCASLTHHSSTTKESNLPHPCPICRGSRERFVPGVDGRAYLSCPNCRLIQLEEAHHLTPEKQKERYQQHQNSPDDPGYVAMFEAFLKAGVDPYVGKPGRALDFGCGPEPVLAWLLERRGHAVDRYDLFFHPDEAYLTRQYDVIILTEVLEHLTEPLGTLRVLAQRLAPGGIFALMTLFHPNDRSKFADWWYRRDPTHVSFYTVKTLEVLAGSLCEPAHPRLGPQLEASVQGSSALGMKVLFSDAKNIVALGPTGV